MDKKFIAGFVGLTILAGIVGGFIIFSKKSQISSPLPFDKELTSQIKILPSTTLKEYSDPSGFVIQYPDDLTISVKQDLDQNSYADITFTSQKIAGNIRLFVQDTKLTKLADGKETTLASMSAVEVKEKDGLDLTAIDKGVLFTIETSFTKSEEENFWLTAYQVIKDNFSFVSSSDTNAASSTSSDVVLEEEVVE